MSSHKFTIYSSSAGSGKTYTLTKEYLKLALKEPDPHYFRHILAITFTNDAANEMKVRIVEALKNFSYPERLSPSVRNNSQSLLLSLAEECQMKPEELSKRAQAVFHKIMYNYADFAVSTIDAFVNKIVNAFTRELDIPHNYEVDLDTKALLQLAVDRVLEKVGKQNTQDLSRFIVKWVQDKTEEGKTWNRIGQDLVDFAEDLMNESAYPYLKALEKLSIADFHLIQKQMQTFEQSIEGEIKALARKGQAIIGQEGLGDSDFYYSKKGVPGYFKKWLDKFDMEKAPNNYVLKALEEDKWSTKPNPQILAIAPQLKEIIEKIEALREKHVELLLLVSKVSPEIYKLALIKEIEIELAEVKKGNNSIHISDSNKKISEIIQKEPIPYVYERVGEKFNHILIDEFQDTSVLQWQNLLPLVENNLSEGYFNLVVGDAKQAIYRWRGGEMEQLVYLFKNRIEELINLSSTDSPFIEERYLSLQANFSPQNLRHNYRSSAEIIHFNNEFFQSILQSEMAQKFPLVREIYDDSFQQEVPPQNKKTGGHISMNFIPKDEYSGQTLAEIQALIEDLVAQGYAYRDIAILTRGNTRGKEVANYLKKQGIEVLSQTSLLLASDEKVRFLVALLKVIHRPEDTLAKSEALYLFYKVIKERIPNPNENIEIQEIVDQSLLVFYKKFEEEGFVLHHARMQALEIYELSEKIIEVFGLLDRKGYLEYLFRFLDVLLQFKLQKNTSLGEFLEFWEAHKEKLSINTPKDINAVTVTTIHKSKGLEYPVLILAFADWSLVPKGQIWVHIPPEAKEAFQLPNSSRYLESALVNMSETLEASLVKDQYLGELEKAFIENINLLYVALTRPVHRLYIFSKRDDFSSKNGQKGVHYLLKLYLEQKGLWEEEESCFVISEGDKEARSKTEENKEYFYIDELISTDVHKKIRRRKAKSKK